MRVAAERIRDLLSRLARANPNPLDELPWEAALHQKLGLFAIFDRRRRREPRPKPYEHRR